MSHMGSDDDIVRFEGGPQPKLEMTELESRASSGARMSLACKK
jgi:hypothetical protein